MTEQKKSTRRPTGIDQMTTAPAKPLANQYLPAGQAGGVKYPTAVGHTWSEVYHDPTAITWATPKVDGIPYVSVNEEFPANDQNNTKRISTAYDPTTGNIVSSDTIYSSYAPGFGLGRQVTASSTDENPEEYQAYKAYYDQNTPINDQIQGYVDRRAKKQQVGGYMQLKRQGGRLIETWAPYCQSLSYPYGN